MLMLNMSVIISTRARVIISALSFVNFGETIYYYQDALSQDRVSFRYGYGKTRLDISTFTVIDFIYAENRF